MRLQTSLVGMCLAAILVAPPLHGQKSRVVDAVADPEVARIGASQYEWNIDDNAADVEIRNEKGTLANVAYWWDADGSIRISWASDHREQFAIDWQGDRFTLRLPNGTSYSKWLNRDTMIFDTDSPYTEDELLKRADEITASAEILANLDRLTGRSVARRKLRLRSDCITNCGPGTGGIDIPQAPGPGGVYGTICLGAWVWGEAYSMSARRSEICAQAAQDANNKCSNRYCWGCCAQQDCNAYCQLGDFFCITATVAGRQCNG